MKGQYEQYINAAGLADLGVPVIQKLELNQIDFIQKWVDSDRVIQLHIPDKTQEIVDHVLSKYIVALEYSNQWIREF